MYLGEISAVGTPDTHLIVTKLFKDLLKTIMDRTPCGVIIRGPPGTGKSTSCIYLWKMLKDADIPFLVCFIETFDPNITSFHHYIRGFLQGNCFITFFHY